MLEVSRPSWFDAGRPGAFDVLCWRLLMLALAGVAPTRATRPLWRLAVGGTFDLLAGVCGHLRALISMTRWDLGGTSPQISFWISSQKRRHFRAYLHTF